MERKFYHLKNVDAVDINDVLLKVQRSFDIKFNDSDIGQVAGFDDLCDAIRYKISLQHEETCTTQHAFYLLRNAIAGVTGTDKCSITPRSRLSKLFPKESCHEIIADIEREMDINIHVLQPKRWIVAIFSLLLAASLIGLFFTWQIGLLACLASVLGLKLAGKFGKEIHLKTVGDLAHKISRESYIKAKRNPAVNRNEIEQKIRELFAVELELKPVMIMRKGRL